MDKQLSEFNKNLKKAMNIDPSKPIMSVNKLAEYQQANSTRRRAIVKAMKQDKDFRKAYYSNVKNLFPKYVKSEYDESLLESKIKSLNKRNGDTKWENDDINNSIIALESLKSANLPDLSDYEIITDVKKLESIELSGVTIIIKPDMYLRNIHSKKIGGIKSHYSKTEKNRLGETGRASVATIIKYGFMELGYESKQVDNNGCVSIDIFNGEFSCAPGTYKKLIKDLSVSCEEIILRWNSL